MDRIGKLGLLTFASLWLFTAIIVVVAVWLVSPVRANAVEDSDQPPPPAVFNTLDQNW